MKETLANEIFTVEIDYDEKSFFGRDLKDRFNDPAFLSQSRRTFAKAAEAMKAQFTEKTSLHDAEEILEANGIKTHYWCMMD